jgi:hypothetical protein
MLDFLESVHLTPGITGTVTSRSADGNIAVRLNNQVVDLDAFASSRILVRA